MNAERIHANLGLNEPCEATAPAKLRLIGRSMRSGPLPACRGPALIGIPLSPPPPPPLKDAHLIDTHIVPAWSGVRARGLSAEEASADEFSML